MSQPDAVGLQAERTQLAWTRTALSLLGVALLALRLAADEPVVLALWAPVALGALLVAPAARWRAHRLHTGTSPAPPPPGLLALVVATVVLAALSGLVAVALT